MIRSVLAAFLLIGAPHFAASAERLQPGTFKVDADAGFLSFLLPAAKDDRYFHPTLRINYDDGTAGSSSFGCFPFPCPKDVAPFGSTSSRDLMLKDTDRKTIKTIDLFLHPDQASFEASRFKSIAADSSSTFVEKMNEEFAKLVKDGVKIVRLYLPAEKKDGADPPSTEEKLEPIVASGVSVKLPAEWKKHVTTEIVSATPTYSKQEQAYIGDYRKREKAGEAVEEFPQGLLRKAGDGLPRHIRIRFENLPEFAFEGGTVHRPEITIQRIEDYQLVESIDGKPDARKFTELEKIAFEKDFQKPLKQVPFIRFVTTGTHYFSKRIAFRNGKGVRFVTRFAFEADVLHEGVLAYFYQGITVDRKHFIFATFPIKMPGLEGNTHLGYSTEPREEYLRLVHGFKDYLKKAEAWMHDNEATIQPRLELLDRIMQSISVDQPELGE